MILERSRNFERDGKLVASVDYRGTLKGAVIVPFGYYPLISLRKSRNFHLDRWQPTWNFKWFLPVKVYIFATTRLWSLLVSSVAFIVCLFVLFFNFMDSPVSCYSMRFFTIAFLQFFPSIAHKLLTVYIWLNSLHVQRHMDRYSFYYISMSDESKFYKVYIIFCLASQQQQLFKRKNVKTDAHICRYTLKFS